MKRRVIALLVLTAFVGLPLLAGCQHEKKDEASLKVDTEGSTKSVKVDTGHN